MVDGMPSLSWSPDLGNARRYRKFGAKSLASPMKWKEINDESQVDDRFFKVSVELCHP